MSEQNPVDENGTEAVHELELAASVLDIAGRVVAILLLLADCLWFV